MIAYSVGAGVNIGNVPAAGVPANGVIANVLQGTPFDLVTEDGIFSLYMKGNAIGLTHTLYLIENGVQKTIIPTSAIFLASTVNGLKVNEDLVMRFRVKAGSRMGHQISNTTAAAVAFDAHYVIE